MLSFVGVLPPAKIPLIELFAPPRKALTAVKSPKSVASPADAIVTKSIVLSTVGVLPPTITPRVALEHPVPPLLADVRSPKLAESPVVAMVINSITFV